MNAAIAIEKRRHRADSPWTYAQLDRRQREIAPGARRGEAGRVLLSEVAPVITVGRRTPPSDLVGAGVETLPVDRGGFATYHGPGQWVLFAVDRLEALTGDRRGVRRAVEGLLACTLEVARHFEPRAEIRQGCELGVWAPSGKIAALGVHIEDHVLQHGVSLNGFRTPESFQGLRPCGLDLPVGYLLEGLAGQEREAAFSELGDQWAASVARYFWKTPNLGR